MSQIADQGIGSLLQHFGMPGRYEQTDSDQLAVCRYRAHNRRRLSDKTNTEQLVSESIAET
jgi:hypothetical protein